jgi:hypothetical protein
MTETAHGGRRSLVLAVLVIAFTILTGFGIQQAWFQRQQSEHDACVDRWASKLVEGSLESRSDAVARRDAAQTARDDAAARKDAADDAVLLKFRRELSRPKEDRDPVAVATAFLRLLDDFRAAKRDLARKQVALDEAQGEVKKARRPYPKLRCD